jgi:hypothetical protein
VGLFDDPEPDVDELSTYEAALALQNGLLTYATGGAFLDSRYSDLRRRLMADPITKTAVPPFVRTCHTNGTVLGAREAMVHVCGAS